MFFIFCLFVLNPTCHSGAQWSMHSALSSHFLLQQSLSEVDLTTKEQMPKSTQASEGTQLCSKIYTYFSTFLPSDMQS